MDMQIWYTPGNCLNNGKEFRNRLATELYKRLNIEHTTTAAYHPQCNNCQVSKLFCGQNNSGLGTISRTNGFLQQHKSSPIHSSYSLTYGQDARLPSFPNPDIQRCYSETPAGDWYNSLQAARDLATRNKMKATTRAEQVHNKRAELHNYKVGQQIWLDECNFLSKNKKLASKWAGPYWITKVRDNGNIRIQLEKKAINVNVNHIKPFIATNPEEQQQQQQQQQPQIQTPGTPQPAEHLEQKEEEQPWIEVKRKQKSAPQDVP
jgi:hypothetical protein